MSSADAEDDSKAEELDKQMDGFMKQLGPEFQTAFEAGADLDPESEDGKVYDAAMDKLDESAASNLAPPPTRFARGRSSRRPSFVLSLLRPAAGSPAGESPGAMRNSISSRRAWR